MKHPGVWFLCASWPVFAVTGLRLAVSGDVAVLTATGILALFFTALFVGLGVFAGRLPLDRTKLPHPEYWLSREHRLEFKALIADLMFQFAAGIVLFVALINIGMFVQWGWYSYAIAVALLAVVLAPTIRFMLQLNRIPRASQLGTDGGAGRRG
jgi:cell division protein FtsW (lipid II flippase)